MIRREREWALCKFITARDSGGLPYHDEWRRFADLLPLATDEQLSSSPASSTDVPPTPVPVHDPKTVPPSPVTMHAPKATPTEPGLPPPMRLFDEPIPNEHTMPAPGQTDAMRDTVRPERARRPPDRLEYSALALSAAYAECSQAGFDLHARGLPDAAFHVDVSHGADRLVACAFDLFDSRDVILLLDDEKELRASYDSASHEMQRALMIAADVDQVSVELGSTSPQAILLRELYAVNAVDAAMHGHVVPYLEPTVSALWSDQACPLGDIFDERESGNLFQSHDAHFGNELFALSKAKSSPDIFSERQMKGAEWDTPKELELAKIKRLNAVEEIAADDPSIKGMQICQFTWTGRRKRNPDGTILKDNARLCSRGDLDKQKFNLTANDRTAPVARNSSNLCFDSVACIRGQHKCDFDVPGAYLQGEQYQCERRLYRPPKEARVVDERGVEILWLSNSPFYGQTDAGAIWNRTVNGTLTSPSPPHGCGLERCPQDPSIYAVNVKDGELGGQCNNTLYVDDGRLGWDDGKEAIAKAESIKKSLGDKYGIKFGADDPVETHFLGANIITEPSRRVASVRATSYIDLQVKRYADGDVSPCKRFPAHWSSTPADETLVRAWEAAVATRTPASPELTTRYGSLFGSLLHAVKFRPEIAAALGLCGSCLTFPTEELYECLMHVLVYLGRSRNLGTTYSAYVPNASKLEAYADSNWNVTRSVTGFVIMLGGAAVVAVSRRQHCITMSSCEAELVALADLAIELLHVIAVVSFLGEDQTQEPVKCATDSKAAYDLCHRFTSAQNSRHIDRKLFKMRELRGAATAAVRHIPGETNPADLFTKILTRQPFEKHRKFVLNLPGDTGVEFARRTRLTHARSASSQRDETAAP